MALFQIFAGNEEDLQDVAFHEGYAYFTPDTSRFHIDATIIKDDGTEIKRRYTLNAVDASAADGLYVTDDNGNYLLDDNGDKVFIPGRLFRKITDLNIEYGGTGRASLTTNALVVGNGTNPVKLISIDEGSLIIGDATDGITGLNGVGALYAAIGGQPRFGTIPLDYGGTGATDAEDARNNLEVYSKQEVEAKAMSVSYSVTLQADGWTEQDDKFIYNYYIPELTAGSNNTVPTLISPINNIEEYSNIIDANITIDTQDSTNTRITFTTEIKPTAAIQLVIVDIK